MIPSLLHRRRTFSSWQKMTPLLTEATVKDSVQGVADWLDAASDATGEPGLCFRSSVFHPSGEISWTHPHSNTSELISAWLDIAEMTAEDRNREPYRAKAIAYGDRLVSDPVRGFYRGEMEEAQGLAWYWTDDSTYTGGYSMRAPAALHRLHVLTGDARYQETCEMIGRTFLLRQLPNGFVNMVGWCPQKGWLSERIAGCRYVYSLATFATLYQITSDAVYQTAYEKAVAVLLQMQREDGAFYQHYDPVTLEPTDSSIKLHFFSYIFNALAEAYAIFRDERLVSCAKKMGDFLVATYAARHQLPYCLDPVYKSDLSGAHSAIQDSANGLFWLSSVTKDPAYSDLAVKLWLEAWLNQPVAPNCPGWHGAIPIGDKRCDVWFATSHLFASRRLLDFIS